MASRDLRQSGDYRSTLVIPAYNAAAFIWESMQRLRHFVEAHGDWCVLLVCDGCSDDTASLITEYLHDAPPAIRMHAYEKNRGKGYALRTGLNLANTPYLAYTDVDLAYDPEEAIKIVRLLEEGADLAAANRTDPATRFLMSPQDFPTIYRRHRMSRVFNWWLRMMLPITILDTQAGLKGMTAEAWRKLAPRMSAEGFFFDVELLAWAGVMNMTVAEAAVNFRYVDPTTVKMVQHGWEMIKDTLRLRRELKRTPAAPAVPAEAPVVAEGEVSKVAGG